MTGGVVSQDMCTRLTLQLNEKSEAERARMASDKNQLMDALLNQPEGETMISLCRDRSQDVLTANNWNVVQYAVLVHMLAQVCDMYVGEFVHVIADAHIYDRHVDLVKELISRPVYDAPAFWLNPRPC